MRRLTLALVLLLVVSGCQAPRSAAAPVTATPTPTVAAPAPAGAPTTQPAPTGTSRPRRSTETPATPTTPTAPPSAGSPTSAPSAPAGNPKGVLTFDPFDVIACTWVPRLFVDLSGHSKPGIDVRIPLLASNVDNDTTVTIRSEINGALYSGTTTVDVPAPQWRGNAHVALRAPDFGNYVSIVTQLDTKGVLGGTTSARSLRTVEGMIPDPRPATDQGFACTQVT